MNSISKNKTNKQMQKKIDLKDKKKFRNLMKRNAGKLRSILFNLIKIQSLQILNLAI